MTTTEIDQQQVDKRTEYIAGLRAFADALEKTPDLPLPLHGNISPISWNLLGDEGQRETAAGIIRGLGGSWQKDASAYFYARTTLRGLHLEVAANREAICTRKVVGQKAVTKKVATVFEEQEVTEDIVEWDCSPLLQDSVR